MDAGVDRTTAFARARAHPDFKGAWGEALRAHDARKEAEEAEAIAALRDAPSPQPLSREGRGAEELVVSGGQVRRVSGERWGKRKEAIFFDELAATANIHRSAAAAGVSYNAVHARRLKHPLFAAKWDAVERSARAAIGMHLIEETQKAFDPAALNLPEGPPRVTIDQAIKISQIGAAKAGRDAESNPFEEDGAAMEPDEADALRTRVLGKLARMQDRRDNERREQGWSYDEQHKQMIPPGWEKRNQG